MSDRGPGTQAYLIDTALVVCGGIALAVWLWDGWQFDAPLAWNPAGSTEGQPRTLAEALDAGCLTADNLAALRDRRPLRIHCPGVRP